MAAEEKKPTKKATSTKKRSAKKKTTDPIVEEIKEPVVANTDKPKKKAWKFDDSALINVQSNVFGELIYIDSHTGDKVVWGEFGDIQPMTMGALRSMRSTQRGFFENNWVFIHEVIDEDYEGAQPEDVYKALLVSQYYHDTLEPDRFDQIFNLDDSDLIRIVSRMSAAGRMNLVVASNEAIKNGTLDSLHKIRLLENLLDCELVELT